MRTPATSSRHKILSLLAVVALVLGLVPALGSQAAAADEADGGALAEGGEPLSGLLASGSEGGAQSQVGGVGVGLAEGTGETFPEGAAEGSSDGSSQEVPLIAAAQLSREVALQPLSEGDGVPLVADVLAGKPTCFVSRDVPLAGDAEPVLGSFTVDGLTFAMTEEGEVELVAVAPGVLAGSLAAGEPGGSSEGIGSGVLASPQSSPEGAPSDGPESADGSSEPVALAVPGTVEHDGADYSVSSVGPRAFAGCDADVVSFPATVSSVDEAAFRGSLVGAVEVAEGNPHVASYEGVLYDADFSDLLLIPEGKEGAVRIHSNTSAITPGAFSHCASVTSVEVDAGNESFYVEDGVLCDADGNSIFDRLTMSFQDELGIGGNEDTVQSYGLTPGHPESGAVPQESFADLSSASNSRGFYEQTIVRVKGQTGGINWEDSRSTWRYSNSGYYYHVAAVGTQTYFPRSANSPGRILKGFALHNGQLYSPGS